ncbi:hypothetical protein [Streptomyces sp. NPDC050263]|uniref:hypothetical protein n=1 Tax=Streptomyces sp. NPDC050263 TaxID=3155037 RepID=UPI003431D4F9
MRSRAQSAQTRGVRWSTPVAFLRPALAALIATAVLCLGCVTHGSGGHAAPMTTLSAGTAVAAAAADAPAEPHSPPAADPGDCPYGDVCCAQALHHVTGVLAASVQPSPAVLPRRPALPRRGDGPTLLPQPPPGVDAPDLHVLQVQRT